MNGSSLFDACEEKAIVQPARYQVKYTVWHYQSTDTDQKGLSQRITQQTIET